jgi:hypothetical protein
MTVGILIVRFQRLHLIPLEFRAAFACWEAVFGLDEHLLHAVLLLVKHMVHLVQVFEADTVGNHFHGSDLLVLNHLEERLPV